MIDIFYPYVPEDAKRDMTKTLATRWIGQGPKVEEFEHKFKLQFNQKYPVSVNSGTAALDTAYELAEIERGDKVITTPLTCTATNIGLLHRGAHLIWADINPFTLCMDVKDVLKKINDDVKAVVNVHLGGIANYIAAAIPPPTVVISDSCQALGVFDGDFTCNSFQAIKHITTGDGGMLCCPDEKTYRTAKLMRWFGIDREKKIANNWHAYKERAMTFDIEIPGYKRQMTDIAATLGIAGLRHYDHVINYRKELFLLYAKNLSGLDGLRIVAGPYNTYWLFTVIVERRDDFARMLFDAGVDTNVVQLRNDIYKIFGGKRQDLPVMNELEFKYISLPLHMKVTKEDVNFICRKIRQGW